MNKNISNKIQRILKSIIELNFKLKLLLTGLRNITFDGLAKLLYFEEKWPGYSGYNKEF